MKFNAAAVQKILDVSDKSALRRRQCNTVKKLAPRFGQEWAQFRSCGIVPLSRPHSFQNFRGRRAIRGVSKALKIVKHNLLDESTQSQTAACSSMTRKGESGTAYYFSGFNASTARCWCHRMSLRLFVLLSTAAPPPYSPRLIKIHLLLSGSYYCALPLISPTLSVVRTTNVLFANPDDSQSRKN